jgi:transcriptional regulator with XRE-family HTH domain
MKVVDVHNRIKGLADERGLSPYELAKRSGMALSSLYNMFERGTMPKIDTLEKLCNGMEISLSDFFMFLSKPRAGGYLSEKDMALIEINRELTERNQDHLLVYAQGMKEAQNSKPE